MLDVRHRADRESAARADDHRALRLWLRLLTCTQLIEANVRPRLRERHATTLPRFDLMSQLQRHPEGFKMNELSRRMMVTGGNITGIVDQLVREGLVERAADTDRRAYRIRLTRSGARTFGEMAREHEAWILEILAGLSAREQAQLLSLLAKVKRSCADATRKGAPA